MTYLQAACILANRCDPGPSLIATDWENSPPQNVLEAIKQLPDAKDQPPAVVKAVNAIQRACNTPPEKWKPSVLDGVIKAAEDIRQAIRAMEVPVKEGAI